MKKREVVLEGEKVFIPMGGNTPFTFACCDKDKLESVIKHNWCVRGKYPATTINGKKVPMHRLLMPNSKMIDHINGNPFDNRLCNLRECTLHQNLMNSAPRFKKTTRFKGIVKRKNKWRAYITFNGKETHLGYFKSEEEAARAYDKKAKELFGEFARLNFPKEEE